MSDCEPISRARSQAAPTPDAAAPAPADAPKAAEPAEKEEPALKDEIDATSAAEAAAHQSEGGAGEGRGKRVRKAPKLFGEY